MIREATLADTRDLTQLMSVLGYPTETSSMRQRMSDIFNREDYQTFVYERNEKVVGMIGMTFHVAYHTDAPHVRVIAFVVDQEFQGEGIGRKLMEETEAWARTKHAKTIILNSGNRQERKSAHHVYEHFGFEGRATGFYKKL
ncbi:GNAT family N-acetyltransferase [Halobacillus fulvus]|nr:GNAT family N-acetyltransferase [Halobacillus fulvus]